MEFLTPAIATVVAYLIGSLSFAVVVSRLMGLQDPRTYGSKNPGATNVLRSGSKSAAIVTLPIPIRDGPQLDRARPIGLASGWPPFPKPWSSICLSARPSEWRPPPLPLKTRRATRVEKRMTRLSAVRLGAGSSR